MSLSKDLIGKIVKKACWDTYANSMAGLRT